MKIWRKISCNLVLLCLSVIAGGQVTLENSKIKLVTDGKHIISLYDKERGLEHISSDYTAANGLFGISYADAATLVTTGTVDAGQKQSIAFWNTAVKDPDMSSSPGVLMKDYFDAMRSHAKDFL